MAVLGCEPNATQLSAWQFSTAGIVKVPLFELHGPLPATAAVRDYIPSAEDPATADEVASSNSYTGGFAGATMLSVVTCTHHCEISHASGISGVHVEAQQHSRDRLTAKTC